jgi:hypothetical protein
MHRASGDLRLSAALPQTDRKKLAKLLAMLASDKAGERYAAGLAAHRLVTRAGLTWEQIITPETVEKPLPEIGTWRQTCAACLARPGSLRTWELDFLRALPSFRRLSVKQSRCLREIAARVIGEGSRP